MKIRKEIEVQERSIKKLDESDYYFMFKSALKTAISTYRATKSRGDYESVQIIVHRIDKAVFSGKINLDDYERLQASYISDWTSKHREKVVQGSTLFSGQSNFKQQYAILNMIAVTEVKYSGVNA